MLFVVVVLFSFVLGVRVCGLFGVLAKEKTPQTNTHEQTDQPRRETCFCCVLSVNVSMCLVCCRCCLFVFAIGVNACGLFGMMVKEKTPRNKTHENMQNNNNNDKHDQPGTHTNKHKHHVCLLCVLGLFVFLCTCLLVLFVLVALCLLVLCLW